MILLHMRASKERRRDADPGERRSETPPYLARASAWCLGSRRRRLRAAGPSRPPPGSWLPEPLRGPGRSRTCGSCSGAGRRRRRACSSSCSLSRAPWSSRWRRRRWPCICTDGSSPRSSTHRRPRAGRLHRGLGPAKPPAREPRTRRTKRERVLFIGTKFRILYTSMYSPAEYISNLSKRPRASFAHIRGLGHGCAADARVRAHAAEQVRRDALPAAHARGRRVRPPLPARRPARARPVRPARGPVLHAQGPARGPAARRLRPCRVITHCRVGAMLTPRLVFAGSARASAPRARRHCAHSGASALPAIFVCCRATCASGGRAFPAPTRRPLPGGSREGRASGACSFRARQCAHFGSPMKHRLRPIKDSSFFPFFFSFLKSFLNSLYYLYHFVF